MRARGLAWAPEPRGVGGGRAAVAFVEGDVPAYPMPALVWEPRVLDVAARMLRAFHDATVGFPREGRTWQLAAHEPDEVICHNDFAPYNLIFEDGRLLTMDSARPRATPLAVLGAASSRWATATSCAATSTPSAW